MKLKMADVGGPPLIRFCINQIDSQIRLNVGIQNYFRASRDCPGGLLQTLLGVIVLIERGAAKRQWLSIS